MDAPMRGGGRPGTHSFMGGGRPLRGMGIPDMGNGGPDGDPYGGGMFGMEPQMAGPRAFGRGGPGRRRRGGPPGFGGPDEFGMGGPDGGVGMGGMGMGGMGPMGGMGGMGPMGMGSMGMDPGGEMGGMNGQNHLGGFGGGGMNGINGHGGFGGCTMGGQNPLAPMGRGRRAGLRQPRMGGMGDIAEVPPFMSGAAPPIVEDEQWGK